MAATRARPAPSPNGGTAKPVAKGKHAGVAVRPAAGRAKGPLLAAGATAAALAGGLALGTKLGGRRKSGLRRTADVLEKLADGLASAAGQAATATDDMKKIREELEQVNRQSPVEVLLDGLTHRRGAHKRES
jgi:hypothetical protein